MATLKEFIARVVPWPGANTPGVVNTHWRAKNSTTGNFYWSGRPHNTVDSFVSLVSWVNQRQNFIQDVYFCLSLQSKTGKYTRGKPGVARSADNAVALKAIWLDIDVKDPPKGYATRDEALRSLDLFIKSAELPFPTAIVGSGGGLHVYWISKDALDPEAWQPYAEGLKAAAVDFGLRCDSGLTTDRARILRVPDTFNFKTNPPKKVELLWLAPDDLDFQTIQNLATRGRTLVTVTVKPHAAPVIFDLSKFTKPAAAFAGLTVADDHSGDGLGWEDNPLDPRPIISGCPFFKDAFKTHGKDHGQPLWNLAVLATTFWQKGDVLAHEIGNAHPGYTAASTDAMFERKLKERQQKGLGWPSCKAIENEGCTLCKTCPHYGKIKSPLNLVTSTNSSAQTPPGVFSPQTLAAAQPPDLYLPKGYAVDPKTGIICLIAELPIDRGPPIMQLVPLFKCVLSDPWIQSGPRALNFKATMDKGRIEDISILDEKMATLSLLTNELFRQGVLLNTQVENKVREFIVSWKATIQEQREAQKALPFGWVIEEGGKVTGFAYGGKVMHRKENGIFPPDTPAGYGDAEIRQRYAPTGTLTPWLDCMKMISDQNRPDLEIILATAFAGPLMQFVGKDMVTFSAHGDSGAHKSSAMKIASAVWGHPKLTQDVHTSTAKGVLKRLGQIVNIPIFWDELSDKDTIEHVYKTMFVGNQGVEGSTLRSDRSSNARGMWRTSMSINLNESFTDYVAKRQKSTEAGVYRVFEYEVTKKDNTMPEAVASNMIQKLEYNYGGMGLAYAKALAGDPDGVRDFVLDQSDKWAKLVAATNGERNWVAACTVAYCGALLANATILDAAGCPFHVNGMKDELFNSYMRLRHKLTTFGNVAGSFASVRDILFEWFREHEENTIWTKAINMGRGKPKPIDVLSGPPENRKVPVYSQFAVDNRVLRIARTPFVKWLNDKEYSPTVTLRGLANNFGVTETEANLAAGTRFAKGQERLMHFDIAPGSPLEEMLYAKSPNEDKPQTLVSMAVDDPTLAETGIIDAAVQQAAKDLDTVKKAA